MRKVVLQFKPYRTVFYLKIFELGKVSVGAKQVTAVLKSNFQIPAHLSPSTLAPAH
jgi:hypothetical protein